MSRLPTLSSARVLEALRRAGFVPAPRKDRGGHEALVKTEKSGRIRLLVIPLVDAIPAGAMHNILQQAGLSRDTFTSLLKEP